MFRARHKNSIAHNQALDQIRLETRTLSQCILDDDEAEGISQTISIPCTPSLIIIYARTLNFDSSLIGPTFGLSNRCVRSELSSPREAQISVSLSTMSYLLCVVWFCVACYLKPMADASAILTTEKIYEQRSCCVSLSRKETMF